MPHFTERPSAIGAWRPTATPLRIPLALIKSLVLAWAVATQLPAETVTETALGKVLTYRLPVAGTPHDSGHDFSAGPASHENIFSNARRFFPVRNTGGMLGVVWQDQANASLKLTWFGKDLKSAITLSLANPRSERLVCATGDDTGNVYFLTVQPGSGAPTTSRTATLTKANSAGANITSTPLNTSASGLNMVEFFSVASMQYSDGRLGVIIGRTMHRGGDGLNHQGAIAVVFNATTLEISRNWGQTSGHSLESVLTRNRHGEFVGIDLGDNYPRGIHLHKFTDTRMDRRVVSSFKTAHGTSARSPSGSIYPLYPEISGGTTYYRWSNDNRTYTELGGLAHTTLGYSVSFVGERSPDGRLLDNSRATGLLNDPRNVGFLTVVEDFENSSGSGSLVNDDLVVTKGMVETGGFYNFGGGWAAQRNAGVVWLTNYTSLTSNASRLKMAPRADGNLLLLWEIWSATHYVSTRGMVVAPDGTKIVGETDLGPQLRLGRREDPITLGNGIYLISGNKTGSFLELTIIEPAAPSVPLSITRLGNSVIIDWPEGVNGVLQESDSLASQNWRNSTAGSVRPIVLPMKPGSCFFRLLYTP